MTTCSRVHCRRLLTLFVTSVLGSSLLGQNVRIKPVADSVLLEAVSGLSKAIDAKDPDKLAQLFDEKVVACGPRLWQQILPTVQENEERIGKPVLCVHGRERFKAWGLTELDPALLHDDFHREIVRTLASEGCVPVQTAAFRNGGQAELARILLDRYFAGKGSMQRANAAALDYLWALVPYDLEGAFVTVRTQSGCFLANINADGRVFWIDLLPEKLSLPGKVENLLPLGEKGFLRLTVPGSWTQVVKRLEPGKGLIVFSPLNGDSFMLTLGVVLQPAIKDGLEEEEARLRQDADQIGKVLLQSAEESTYSMKKVERESGVIVYFQLTDKTVVGSGRRHITLALASTGQVQLVASFSSNLKEDPTINELMSVLITATITQERPDSN